MTSPITADRDAWRGPVTDADREAVFALCKEGGVFKGSSSFGPAFEAFARHRLAAEASFKAREDALVEALEKARLLIGAGKGDHPNPAIRESNINQAWHVLNNARAHTATDAERPDA